LVAISSLSDIRPADLPQPPQTTLDVLRACSAEEATHQEIAQKVSTDPLLTAELLRMVNTPLFGLGKEIQSIQHAVTILGSKALRNVVLCLSIGQVIDERAFATLDIKPFWEDSLRRAVTARLLATHSGLNPDDAFTAGLLQDFGLLVLLHLFPDKQPHWAELRIMTPAERLQEENQLFGHTHDVVAAQLMQHWGLPDNLSQSLAHHHDSDGIEAGSMAYTLKLADWINALFVGQDKNSCLDNIRDSLQNELKLDEAQIETLLTEIPPQLELAAQDLGMDVAEQTEFQAVMQTANKRLAAENLSYQELTWKLEHALNERNRLSAELERELQLARSIQQSLLPPDMTADFPVFGINLPAKQLSGDFFDYFPLEDGRIYFNIADVSGKGTHAALLMAKTSSLFRCLGKKKMPLKNLIATINDEIYETNIMGMFVTMTAGCYEPETGRISLLNAGHLPALILQDDGSLKTVAAHTPPLGILPHLGDLQTTTFSLQQACLYLISDGITETQKTNGKQLGMGGFAMLAKQYRQQPLQQRLNSIITELRKLNDKQLDDITLVAIE
jgi:HD-like signal output (HDOD) protein/serine phosphatase RsbU (regulator of sigma subunit)